MDLDLDVVGFEHGTLIGVWLTGIRMSSSRLDWLLRLWSNWFLRFRGNWLFGLWSYWLLWFWFRRNWLLWFWLGGDWLLWFWFRR